MKTDIPHRVWLAAGLLALALLSFWRAQITWALEPGRQEPPRAVPLPFATPPPPAAPAPPPPSVAVSPPAPDARIVAERLIDAMIQVESQGNPRRRGPAGERGLMQIRRPTWRAVTRALFGHPLPFDQAFKPGLNRRIGRAYLAHLRALLRQNQDRWQADERSLLLAAYNAGPTWVLQNDFNLERIPATTRDYIERVSALHDVLLVEEGGRMRLAATLKLASVE